MSHPSVLAFYAILGLGSVVSNGGQDLRKCPTGFANFGDSITDTGSGVDAFPFKNTSIAPDNRPYGETFFGAPAKRYSDGRIVPDFFSLAFGVPLLDAYFAITAFDYSHGVNFAVGGSTATAADGATALAPFSVVPVQVNQFIRFKNTVFATQAQGAACKSFLRKLPSGDPFASWLYTIEVGINDILGALQGSPAAPSITPALLSAVIGNITTAVEILYGESARNFLVYNIPALGCSPAVLAVALSANPSAPLDSVGCIESVNQLIQGYNAGLLEAIQALRVKLPDANIAVFDFYAANIEILNRPAAYGFNPNLTKTACCGAPGLGTFNVNAASPCGLPGSNSCANPADHVVWDGLHFTENFYRAVSEFMLSGNFTDQGIDYKTECNLDYSKFGPGVTYEEAFPDKCNNLFS